MMSRPLHHRLGLARARRAVEQHRESLHQALGLQTAHEALVVALLQSVLHEGELLLLGVGEEEALGLDAVGLDAALFVALVDEELRVLLEEEFLALVGKRQDGALPEEAASGGELREVLPLQDVGLRLQLLDGFLSESERKNLFQVVRDDEAAAFLGAVVAEEVEEGPVHIVFQDGLDLRDEAEVMVRVLRPVDKVLHLASGALHFGVVEPAVDEVVDGSGELVPVEVGKLLAVGLVVFLEEHFLSLVRELDVVFVVRQLDEARLYERVGAATKGRGLLEAQREDRIHILQCVSDVGHLVVVLQEVAADVVEEHAVAKLRDSLLDGLHEVHRAVLLLHRLRLLEQFLAADVVVLEQSSDRLAEVVAVEVLLEYLDRARLRNSAVQEAVHNVVGDEVRLVDAPRLVRVALDDEASALERCNRRQVLHHVELGAVEVAGKVVQVAAGVAAAAVEESREDDSFAAILQSEAGHKAVQCFPCLFGSEFLEFAVPDPGGRRLDELNVSLSHGFFCFPIYTVQRTCFFLPKCGNYEESAIFIMVIRNNTQR